MIAFIRIAPIVARTAFCATVTLVAPHLIAAEAGSARTNGKAHVRPGYVAYPLYILPGACLPYGACAPLWWDDRRQRRRPVAPDQIQPADPDIWGASGSPWGYVRRLPPPTPPSHIQPRYQDASTIRPEFAERDGAATN